MLQALRAAFALFTLVTVSQLASAGPVEWNYKVIDYNPPAPILAQGNGLTDPALVLFTLPRPAVADVNLPDPTTYRWDNYDTNVTASAHVYLTDVASGMSVWWTLGWWTRTAGST